MAYVGKSSLALKSMIVFLTSVNRKCNPDLALLPTALQTDGLTDGPTDGPMDGLTDKWMVTPTYRDARTKLKS